MKKWLARLFGGAEDKAPVHAVAPSTAVREAAAASEPRADIDLLFYRWLTGSGTDGSPCPGESLILDELARLVRAPSAAAELVPRMPAVIPQLLRSLRDESVSGASLARQVSQDVVLVAEVIREANSPYFRPPQPVRTIEGAVMLLGQNGLRMLLARAAFRPVLGMQGGRFAKEVAPRLWSHSEKCALAASLLAPKLGADPFEAFLAGLMQNVGLVIALRVADQVCHDQPLPQSEAFCASLFGSGRALSAAIARHWEFPAGVVHAIAHSGEPAGAPLATALAEGDRLARLRVLLDEALMKESDPSIDELAPARRRLFDQLRIQDN